LIVARPVAIQVAWRLSRGAGGQGFRAKKAWPG
jgi:hypothetical protein